MATNKVEAPVVEAVEEGLSLEKSYDKFIKSQNTGDGLLTEDYDKLEVNSGVKLERMTSTLPNSNVPMELKKLRGRIGYPKDTSTL